MIEVAFLEQFFERRNRAGFDPARSAFARVVGHQLCRRMFDHLAAPVSSALECRVVDDHQLAIHGQVQVQFAAAHAVLETFLKAGQGVFRCFALGAAMAVDEGHGSSLN
ncbi:hypothetical protein D3C86_1618190 [compost metagenome]